METAQTPHGDHLRPVLSSLGPPPGFEGHPRSSGSMAAVMAARLKNHFSSPLAAVMKTQVPIGLRTSDAFVWLDRIGSGSYGVVFRALDRATGEVVAMKAMEMDISTMREIECFTSIIRHPSIVQLKEVVTCNRGGIYLVMEYIERDLRSLLLSMPNPFDELHARKIMLQLLQGVCHLHRNDILHQDLKTQNLLITGHGALKICDFGLCDRYFGMPLRYTRPVATLFYRAPELLLPGPTTTYSAAVDMWSVGCIMAELLVKEPLFCGRDDADQMVKIVEILGKPEQQSIAERRNRLQQILPSPLSSDGLDLLTRLLAHNPNKRISADLALLHPWFGQLPPPLPI